MRSTLRYVIIGCAAQVAGKHLQALSDLSSAHIVGVCDSDGRRGSQVAVRLGCPFFLDHRELVRTLSPDISVICTPPSHHAEQALDCMASGSHVLVEKPMALDAMEADAMIEVARATGRVLAVNFQERFRAPIEKARALVTAGAVGDLVRVTSVEPFLRSSAYYRASSWRGTFVGEGGGVLMNQAPHALDLLCLLAGMPRRVWGLTRTRVHAIAAEDSAGALFEYPGGAMGTFATSTAEGGTERRLDIVGERGALQFVGQKLTFVRFDVPLSERIAKDMDGPPVSTVEVHEARDAPGHRAVHLDLQLALSAGRPPRVDGVEGRKSLELANAIALSHHRQTAVDLPLDTRAYRGLLDQLRAG